MSNVVKMSTRRRLTRLPPLPGDPEDNLEHRDGDGSYTVKVKLVVDEPPPIPEPPEPKPHRVTAFLGGMLLGWWLGG